MKRILPAVVLGLAANAIQAQDSKSVAWQEAIQGERAYCMAEVCMGMSLGEVMALTGTKFTPSASNKWLRNCDGSYSDWESGDFISGDGTRYSIGFRDFPGDEAKEDRFRVQSMALTMLLEWDDFRLLTIKIASRYSMASPPGKGIESRDQEWSTKGLGFLARLNSMYSQPPKTSLLSLSIFSPDYPKWLSSQPLCAKPKKPLPDV